MRVFTIYAGLGPDRRSRTASLLERLAPLVGFLLPLGCRPSFPEPVALQSVPPIHTFSAEGPRAEASPAPALDLSALSIEEAVLLALDNNRDLEVQAYGPVVAGTFARLEQGAFDPEVFGQVEYFSERASQTARATGDRFDVTGESSREILGLRERLPTGTTLEAALSHRLDVSDRTPAQNEARLGLTLTQALLRVFGLSVKLARLRQAELGVQASVHELEAFIAALLAGTEIAYWEHARRKEEIAIFERALAVAKAEEEDVKDRVEVGLLPEIERAAARAEVALRDQALIDAKSRLEEARLRLLRWMSPDDESFTREVGLTTPIRDDLPPLEEVAQRPALALRYRPELLEARARLEQGRLEVEATRNGVLPQLDVFVALGKTGFDRRFEEAFSRLLGPTFDIRTGLDLSYVLGHRSEGASLSAARANKERSQRAISNLEELVRLEVRLALNEVERARAQMRASTVTRRYREKAVEAEKERLASGRGTALLLARAERDLVESQVAELTAAVDHRIARVRLYLAEGTLLFRRGVQVAFPQL